MKVIRTELPPELHDYLVSVVRQHSLAGHEPDESMMLFHLWDSVTKRAQVVELEMPKATTAPVHQSPNGTVHSDGSVEMRTVQVPNPPADEDDLGDR
jgi:hypothetical protein